MAAVTAEQTEQQTKTGVAGYPEWDKKDGQKPGSTTCRAGAQTPPG